MVVLATCLVAGKARGDESTEGEEISFSVRAPAWCVEASSFRDLVRSFGGRFREVEDGRAARRFDVAVDVEERVIGRLVVTDLSGDQDVRIVGARRCEDARRILALMVAMALEGPAEPPPPEPVRATPPWYYVLPVGADAESPSPRKRSRRGSGGVAVTGVLGVDPGSPNETIRRGVHAYAAWLSGRSARLGLAVAVAEEKHRAWTGESFARQTHGVSARVGGLVGWGAPWNDVVAGFRGELGLLAGLHDTASAYASPYVSTGLVLQIPWAPPVRPIAGLSGVLAGDPSGDVHLFSSAEVGLVWQAW